MINEELMQAAIQGHIDTVEQLLKIEAVKKNVHADDNAALEAAASGGH